MITCPLCCEKYIVLQTLCDDCKKVKHAMSLYGSEKVIDVIHTVLVRNDKQIDNKCAIYDKDEENYEKKGGKWILKMGASKEI